MLCKIYVSKLIFTGLKFGVLQLARVDVVGRIMSLPFIDSFIKTTSIFLAASSIA